MPYRSPDSEYLDMLAASMSDRALSRLAQGRFPFSRQTWDADARNVLELWTAAFLDFPTYAFGAERWEGFDAEAVVELAEDDAMWEGLCSAGVLDMLPIREWLSLHFDEGIPAADIIG